MTEKARKHDGDSAFSKLMRLLRLIRFIAEHGRQGVTWKEIRRNIVFKIKYKITNYSIA